ncbi:uncharacterized protein LOC124370988 [Homalodisca vitripennis]|uniref:uncharacterized protein LOC124370988 n=1 Tax=Homalodisca vitripennis TaxID=197043 RepID=UPI001EECAE21|nr:uncharacterized protein LOC124370988 [Homalodisca vitripennis]
MNVEAFVISIRNREAIWNQQLSDHHNRYTLDKLWKEVGAENNCSVKEAQSKWKSLRDYYRKEVRKMQEERSGSSADSVHKSNWPYFLMLDFLRTQFKTSPTSGNLMKKQKTNEDQSVATICDDLSVSKHQLHVENTDEMYAERFSTQDDIDINENGKRLNTDGNVSGKSPECPSSKIDNTVKEDLVHPNTFNKRIVKNDHLKRLVQIEEKKMAILEQKRSRTAHEKI